MYRASLDPIINRTLQADSQPCNWRKWFFERHTQVRIISTRFDRGRLQGSNLTNLIVLVTCKFLQLDLDKKACENRENVGVRGRFKRYSNGPNLRFFVGQKEEVGQRNSLQMVCQIPRSYQSQERDPLLCSIHTGRILQLPTYYPVFLIIESNCDFLIM